jgi:ADP-heptose:LPS heptosyltransferase
VKIAIVKLSSLGDVIHALPVARALRRARPEDELSWIV